MSNTALRFGNESLPAGSRIACRIEYCGTQYHGWQAQSQAHLAVSTVQEELEKALAVVANQLLRVHCAGRTDSGVHGFSQIVHFDAPVTRSAKAWVLGTNANLPRDIRVHWAVPVEADFHARFSALSRSYRYIISNSPVRPALLNGQLSWHRLPLDEELMHRAGQSMLGEQDFSAFRAAGCQSKTPMRNVQSLCVWRSGALVFIDITANAFLHHMVRNIAGSLMAVGSGRQKVQWIAELLEGRDRSVAAETAPADGLYLVNVAYPERYSLPLTDNGPWILST